MIVPTAYAQSKPIPVTGWNADVIIDVDMNVRFGVSIDNGTCCFFEAKAVDDSGNENDDGLVSGQPYTSATGSGAVYLIQPANGNNALQMFRRETGTLTLVTPASYSQLFVIAASGNASQTEVLTGVVHYDDGTSQSFMYNAFDWDDTNNPHAEEAITGIGRACGITDAGTGFTYDGMQRGHAFSLYETSIPTDKTKKVTSVDFSGHIGSARNGIYNVFAISGQ